MAENVQKPTVKDLEPKAGAQDVKGGCLYHIDAEQQAKYYAGRAKDELRQATIPR